MARNLLNCLQVCCLEWTCEAQVSQENGSAGGAESNGSQAGAASEEHPSRFAPSEILEDGSMVYTLSLLQSVDYEAVLAP